jgi:hypothetical protein
VVDTVWLTRLYGPFFIEAGCGCVRLAGCTHSPTGAWVVQQARNLTWKLKDGELPARLLLRDRDSRFSAAFDEVFKSEGVEVIRLPYRAPVANSFAERWAIAGLGRAPRHSRPSRMLRMSDCGWNRTTRGMCLVESLRVRQGLTAMISSHLRGRYFICRSRKVGWTLACSAREAALASSSVARRAPIAKSL